MAVKIEKLNVRDLGPIKQLEIDFGQLNLIFSHNEKGKTFLTEFLIKSLFREISRWSYIRKLGSGKVFVSGLSISGVGVVSGIGRVNKIDGVSVANGIDGVTFYSSDIVEFSPSSKKKLEDFWQEQQTGLPLSMSKLLVVRGGEVSIEGGNSGSSVSGNGGISKAIIKEILSGINVLDRIDNDKNITPTIKQASLTSGRLNISKRGEGKTYFDTKEKFEALKKLFSQVEEKYSQGVIKTQKQEIELLKNKLNLLNDAKKHLAYKLDERIKKFKNILGKTPDEKIQEIEKQITSYNEIKYSYDKNTEEYNKILKDSSQYLWLEKAHQIYQKIIFSLKEKPEEKYLISAAQKEAQFRTQQENYRTYQETQQKTPQGTKQKTQQGTLQGTLQETQQGTQQGTQKSTEQVSQLKTSHTSSFSNYLLNFSLFGKRTSTITIALSIFGLVLTVLGFILANILVSTIGAAILFIIGIIIFAVGLLLAIKAIKKISSLDLSEIIKNEELENIKKDFKEKFGEELTSLAQLEEILDYQKKNYNQLELLKRDIDESKTRLESLYNKIIEDVSSLSGQPINSITSIENAKTILENLKESNQKYRSEMQDCKDNLSRLNVDPSDYLEEFEEEKIQFSFEQYQKTESLIEELKEKLNAQEKEIEQLKHDICTITGSDYSITWDELIESLRQKMFETQIELIEITASIISGILVHQVVEDLKQQEDQKIQQGLKSEKVLKPLREITNRYVSLELDQSGSLIVSDKYDSYDIKDLSTGAKEQVMLALRIGFVKSLIGDDETLFLILDDAFQHSDWQKREILVEKLAEISNSGWQVIYFTMDNHIRDLFIKTAQKYSNLNFKNISL